MDLVGGKLLGSVPASWATSASTGMQVGEVSPVAGAARFQAAMHRTEQMHVEQSRPVILAQLGPTAAPSPAAAPTAAPPVNGTTEARAPGDIKTAAADTARPAGVDAVDAQDRARRTLDLQRTEPSSASTNTGDRILDGLTRLRSVFDEQQGRLTAAMNGPILDGNAMIGLQVEVVNFSMLVDVSSKLTGKSTGALETLMKGQ